MSETNSSFTPGPWHIEDMDDAGDLYIADVDGHPIAILRAWLFGETPTAANACLIAAAPELLLFAEELVGLILNPTDDSYLDSAELRNMRRTIARATGVPD